MPDGKGPIALAEDLQQTAELVDRSRVRRFDPREEAITLEQLEGCWTSCNPNTRGIVRIDLSDKKGSLEVQVFGACSPSPCDWGQVEGVAYADTVADNEAIAFTALYEEGFANRIVTGHLHEGTLLVDAFTRFKKGSGRSNYYDRSYLCRKPGGCTDFRQYRKGEQANPWTVNGYTYTVYDHAGTQGSNAQIESWNGHTGLNCDYRTDVSLAVPASTVEVTLVQFSGPATVEALSGGSVVDSEAMSGRGPETLVLEAPTIDTVIIRPPQNETLLLELCVS